MFTENNFINENSKILIHKLNNLFDGEIINQKLSNGIEVIFIKDEYEPITRFMTFHPVGSAFDPVGKKGMAHLYEHLAFRIKNIKTGKTFAEMAESISVKINGATTFSYINFYAEFPTQVLNDYLALEAARVGNVSKYIQQSDILLELETIRNERNRKISENPLSAIQEVINKSLYDEDNPNHYPTFGKYSDLQTITKDDISKYEGQYINPNNTIFIIIGDYVCKSLYKTIDAYFSNWTVQSTNCKVLHKGYDSEELIKDKVKSRKTSNFYYKNPNLFKGILVCYKAPGQFSKEYFFLIMALELLKINKIISRYTYFVDAIKGLLCISNYADTTKDAYLNYFNNLKEMARVEISDSDFEEIKNVCIKSLCIRYTHKEEMAFIVQLLQYTGELSFNKMFDWIVKSQKKDVLASLQKWMIDNMHINLLLMQEDDNNYSFSDSEEVKIEQSWYNTNTEIINKHKYFISDDKDFSIKNLPKIDNKFIPIWRFTLSNGMKVFGSTIKKTRDIRGTIYIMLDRQSEPVGLSGINMYCGEILWHPKGMSEKKYRERLEKLNSRIDIKTQNNWIEILYETDKNNIHNFFKLISKSLIKPGIREKNISIIKKKIDFRRMTSNNIFSSNSYEVFRGLVYGPEHCYSRKKEGYKNDRKNINSYSLRNYYTKNISPSIIRLTITGNISKNETKEVLIHLAQYKKKRLPKKNHQIYTSLKSGGELYYHIPKAENVHIILCRLAPESHTKEFYTLFLSNEILNKYLTKIIRINNGLSYSTGSDFVSEGNLKYFCVDSTANIVNTTRVLKILKETLFSFAENFTEDMLRFIIRDTIVVRNAVKMTNKRQHKILNITAEYNLLFHIDKFRNLILQNLTHKEVIEVIQNFLKPEYFYTIITGDKEKLNPNIKE